MRRWLSWSSAWCDVVERLLGARTHTIDDSEFDDLLGDTIRRSLFRAVGRDQPPATAWRRIETELQQQVASPRAALSVRPAGFRQAKRFGPVHLLQAGAVVAVFVFLLVTTLDSAPGWWSLPGVRGTPIAAIDSMLADGGAPEALNRLYWVQRERIKRVVPASGKRVDASWPDRLSNVQDARGVFVEDLAGDEMQLEAARLMTPALRALLASRPRDIPPPASWVRESQPVMLAGPSRPGLIR